MGGRVGVPQSGATGVASRTAALEARTARRDDASSCTRLPTVELCEEARRGTWRLRLAQHRHRRGCSHRLRTRLTHSRAEWPRGGTALEAPPRPSGTH